MNSDITFNNDTVIFSCATYGRRARFIHVVVNRLINNPTFPQNAIVIINVPENAHKTIQTDLLNNKAFVFVVPEDLGSFNKFYYTARKFLSHTIVLFDDDMDYNNVDLNEFIKHKNSGCVLGGHIHPLTNYRYNYEINYTASTDTYDDVLAVGSHIVLYPPYSLMKTLYHAKHIARKTMQDDVYLRFCTKHMPVMIPTNTWNSEHGAISIKAISDAERGISYKRQNIDEIADLLKDKFIFSDILENDKTAEDIDYVVPYAGVNYVEVAKFLDEKNIKYDIQELHKRFNYGEKIFKLALRGISKNLPFIKNVIIIISHNTHIPKWLDTNKVRLVYIEDLIDGKLPYNLNACTIETLLAKIPNLSPRFLYACDDIIVTRQLSKDDFFCGNYTRIKLFDGFGGYGPLWHYITNAYLAVAEKLNLAKKPFHPEYHSVTPMVTKRVKEVYDMLQDRLYESLTPLRSDINFNQCLYPIYDAFKGYVIPKDYKFAYTENNRWKKELADCDIVCLNNIDDTCAVVDAIEHLYGLTKCGKYEKNEAAEHNDDSDQFN